ncbi:MAG: cation diffusion facilitator family transporter [Phascolarctobacterium sp.]|nr:cation diffusion facilitator family transporter [Phascolarctobacterium sp.]
MHFTNESEKIAITVSINNIIGNLILSFEKLVAGFFANSTAMFSDGIHSASDVIGTLIVMIGVKLSNKASDDTHQYGHERLECVAAIILSVILVFIAITIGYNGLQKIFASNATLVVPGKIALWAAAISIIIKEAMFWYTRSAAKKIASGALLAEAWRHRSDSLSSVGSFIGIFGARMGYPILDPVASILICLMILYTAYEIFADAMEKMVDHSCDEETTAAMNKLISKVPGVMNLDRLTTRIFGNRIYVDIEISVNDNLSLLNAHHIAETVHTAIETNFPKVKHCMVHVNPLSEAFHFKLPILPLELHPQ